MTDKANDTITPTEGNNTHEGNSIKKESKKGFFHQVGLTW